MCKKQTKIVFLLGSYMKFLYYGVHSVGQLSVRGRLLLLVVVRRYYLTFLHLFPFSYSFISLQQIFMITFSLHATVHSRAPIDSAHMTIFGGYLGQNTGGPLTESHTARQPGHHQRKA